MAWKLIRQIPKISTLGQRNWERIFSVLSPATGSEFITQQGGQILGDFSHVVVLGAKLSNTVVGQLDPLMWTTASTIFTFTRQQARLSTILRYVSM